MSGIQKLVFEKCYLIADEDGFATWCSLMWRNVLSSKHMTSIICLMGGGGRGGILLL